MTFPTQEEIVQKIREVVRSGKDPLGFEYDEYVIFLDYEHAREFLGVDATEEDWGPTRPQTEEEVIKAIREYMPFAWDKANNCRAISASRSLGHMKAWLWLLGERDAANRINDYTHYGKPQLRAICEHFDIDWRTLDNGEWRNSEVEEGTGPRAPAELWI